MEFCNEHTVYHALNNKYPAEIITLILTKTAKSELTQSLRHVIRNFVENRHIVNKTFHSVVRQFLSEAEGVFDPSIAFYLLSADYPEDVFLKIMSMTDEKEFIKKVDLSKVVKLYSDDTTKMLLEKGVPCDYYAVIRASERQCCEKILDKLIDACKKVYLKEIYTAQEIGYSNELIIKMRSKCNEQEFCTLF